MLEIKPKFLVVTDDEAIILSVLRRVTPHAQVFTADTPEQGWMIFQLHQDTLKVIFLDGHLRGGKSSLLLLERIRATNFPGDVISITHEEVMRRSMFPIAPNENQAVCDGHVSKNDLADYMIKIVSHPTSMRPKP